MFIYSNTQLNLVKQFLARVRGNEQIFYKPGCEVFVEEMADIFHYMWIEKGGYVNRKPPTDKQLSFLLECAKYDENKRRRNTSRGRIKAVWLRGKRRYGD